MPPVRSAPTEAGSSQRTAQLRKGPVLVAEPTSVMGRQHDLDIVVDVGPFRMVVGLLGGECDAAHEAPGLVEVGELQAALDGVAARNFLPFRQAGESLGSGGAGELGG